MRKLAALQVCGLIAVLGVFAVRAAADTALTREATSSGAFNEGGSQTTGSYVVGDPGYKYHNYFTFDLTDVTAQITSASLRLYTFDCQSPSANTKVEIYELRQATLPLSYGGLVDGPAYGTRGISGSDRDKYVTIPLNSDFLSAANDARGVGSITLGGLITNLGTDPVPEKLFGYQDGVTADHPQLELTVIPLPTGVWMGMAFLAGLAVLKWTGLLARWMA